MQFFFFHCSSRWLCFRADWVRWILLTLQHFQYLSASSSRSVRINLPVKFLLVLVPRCEMDKIIKQYYVIKFWVNLNKILTDTHQMIRNLTEMLLFSVFIQVVEVLCREEVEDDTPRWTTLNQQKWRKCLSLSFKDWSSNECSNDIRLC